MFSGVRLRVRMSIELLGKGAGFRYRTRLDAPPFFSLPHFSAGSKRPTGSTLIERSVSHGSPPACYRGLWSQWGESLDYNLRIRFYAPPPRSIPFKAFDLSDDVRQEIERTLQGVRLQMGVNLMDRRGIMPDKFLRNRTPNACIVEQ